MAGLILGVQILGGFPQIAFYSILAVLAFAGFHGIILLKKHQFSGAFKLGLGLVVIMGIGFALASIQVLPTMEFTQLSTRAGGISYSFATYDSLHPKELLSFLAPDIFGNVIDHTYWRKWEGSHFWETCGYVGIVPLFFIFVRSETRTIRDLRVFFILLMIFSLFLSLGKNNPFYPLIYQLPGFNSFRIPAQILFLYVFSVAVVSGMGLDRIIGWGGFALNKGYIFFVGAVGIIIIFLFLGLHFLPRHFLVSFMKYFSEGSVTPVNMIKLYERISFSIDNSVMFFSVSLLLIIIQKIRKMSAGVLYILVAAILIIDLYTFGGQFIHSYEFKTPKEKKNLIDQLSRNPIQGRVLELSRFFKPNDGLQYRYCSILGYDPMISRRYVYYEQSSQGYHHDDHVVRFTRIKSPKAKLFRLLNARQIILDDRIIDFEKMIPYAHIVNNVVIKPLDDVLSFMKSEDFEPAKMVVFEPKYETGLTYRGGANESITAAFTVLEYGNESIHIRTASDQAGYLVLAEIFYPGWRATVDGVRVSVLEGNYMFRVIPVESGKHDIHLQFVSWPFRIGFFISLFTLAGSFCFLFLDRKWRKIPKGPGSSKVYSSAPFKDLKTRQEIM